MSAKHTREDDDALLAMIDAGKSPTVIAKEKGLCREAIMAWIWAARHRRKIYPLDGRARMILVRMDPKCPTPIGDWMPNPADHAGKDERIYLREHGCGVGSIAVINTWLQHHGCEPLKGAL